MSANVKRRGGGQPNRGGGRAHGGGGGGEGRKTAAPGGARGGGRGANGVGRGGGGGARGEGRGRGGRGGRGDGGRGTANGRGNNTGNRGGGGARGGQQQQPGRGGAISRKGTGGIDEDDLLPLDDPEDEWDNDDDEPVVANGKFNDKGAGGVRKKAKVEMQILNLSKDAQDKVEQTLQDLYGGQYKLRDARSYKDTGGRLDNRFWVRDRQLMVRGVEGATVGHNGTGESGSPEGVNQYAMAKLEECGFHRSRCVKALEECEGDVGLALEQLLGDFLQLEDDDFTDEVDEESAATFSEMMEDEKTALESIYGEAFTERVPGHVWEMRLELQGTKKYLRKEERPAKPVARTDEKNVCRFHLRGHCKFGKRCKQKHINPEKQQMVDDKHLRKPREENVAFLEVRFPAGTHYPRDPPLVCFSTPASLFPKSASLHVTRRLMDEAKMLASDHAPSVFGLVSLLENIVTIEDAVKAEVDAFGYAEDLVPKSALEKSEAAAAHLAMNSTSNLMSGLGLMDDGDGDDDAGDDCDGNGETEAHMAKRIRAEEAVKMRDKMMEENIRMRKRYQARPLNDSMQQFRRELPAWNSRIRILETLKRSQVVVISGMTGCGKSTQVPQYILDDWLGASKKSGREMEHCNIICTQPRRISAIGVAERVAQERNEKAGNTVGYSIRLETKSSSATRLLFCTTGILLRRLESDPNLALATHIVVDEVHERSEDSDFLLMILRGVLRKRPDLKVLLMSATLNANLFSDYFGDIPVIEIPGRTFPVEQIFLEAVIDMTGYTIEESSPYAKRTPRTSKPGMSYKAGGNMRDVWVEDFELERESAAQCKPPKEGQRDEQLNPAQVSMRYSYCNDFVCRQLAAMDSDRIDYDLIESTLVFIADGDHDFPRTGSILVFLPGMQEIMNLNDQIVNHPLLGARAGKFKIVPLHSSLSSEDQAAVFSRPKHGVRKIVISTNLAETSITIDDCVFVVDAGRMKEKRFDPSKNMESLDTVWISQANGLQRKGRAGRVMPGFCFHLYTSFRFEKHLRRDPVPEILRVPLEQMVLRIKVLPLFKNKTVESVLRDMIEPPLEEGMQSAIVRLKGVGALDTDCDLTPLGFHLASLPVDVRIGKLLLFGAVFCCLDSALTIAAALSYRSPFLSPFGKREEAQRKKLSFAMRNSDHLATLRAYQAWHEASKRNQSAAYHFAQDNFISHKTCQLIATMKHQYLELLSGIGFAPPDMDMRDLSRKARSCGGDAVLEATGPEVNANGSNYKLVVSVLCAALYPNIVQSLTPELKYKATASGAVLAPHTASEIKFKTKTDGYVHIHPSSVNAQCAHYENPYLVYHEKIKTSRVFIRELSMVPLYPMILFGGTGVRVELQRGQFLLSLEDGWIKFVAAEHRMAELLKEMRYELDQLLAEKIEDPKLDLLTYGRGKLIIGTIVHLVSNE